MQQVFRNLIAAYCEKMGGGGVTLEDDELCVFVVDDIALDCSPGGEGEDMLFVAGYVTDVPGDESERERFYRLVLDSNGYDGVLPTSMYYDDEFDGIILCHRSPLAAHDVESFDALLGCMAERVTGVRSRFRQDFHLVDYEAGELS